MIIYFSSTGNSKYVAKKIAEATDDWTKSITKFEYGDRLEIKDKGVLGIVCPTYFGNVPENVKNFIANIKTHIGSDIYCFFVATYGGKCFEIGDLMEKDLAARNIKLDARFSVKMVDNWTPMFDVSDTAKNNAINDAAEPLIDRIIEHVKNRDCGDFMDDKAPQPPTFPEEYDKARQTSNFFAEEGCVRCMLCVKRCPSKAIKLSDKGPVWIKESCFLCLGCLHRCPQNIIQYGDQTKGHGQYKNPHDLVWEA